MYVQPFPPTGEKWQVSNGGGAEPQWRSDGQELFYLALDRKLMAVPIAPGAAFEVGTPQPLFETRVPFVGSPYRLNYDATSDGQKFLVNTVAEAAPDSSITVIINGLTAPKQSR